MESRKLDNEIREYLNSLGKNRIITIGVILVLLFILYLLWAYYPLIKFKLEGEDFTNETIEWETSLADELQVNSGELKNIPDENMLVIPRIGVKTKILEGDSLNVLNEEEGVWREPQTSLPERGSNMVIAGHRRQFLPPNTATFYLLPELRKNDYIIVYWNKQEYKYRVIASFETSRYDSDVYEKTHNTTITLYTCTPLDTATKRWVIKAEQVI